MTWTIEPNLVPPNRHDRQSASPFPDTACVLLQNTVLKTVVLSQTENLPGQPCTNHLFSAAETGMHVVKMGFKVISDTDRQNQSSSEGWQQGVTPSPCDRNWERGPLESLTAAGDRVDFPGWSHPIVIIRGTFKAHRLSKRHLFFSSLPSSSGSHWLIPTRVSLICEPGKPVCRGWHLQCRAIKRSMKDRSKCK